MADDASAESGDIGGEEIVEEKAPTGGFQHSGWRTRFNASNNGFTNRLLK